MTFVNPTDWAVTGVIMRFNPSKGRENAKRKKRRVDREFLTLRRSFGFSCFLYDFLLGGCRLFLIFEFGQFI